MSRTEVQTLERVRHNNDSNSSLSVHLRAPHPADQDVAVLRKSHPSHEDIEMAQMSRTAETQVAVARNDTESKTVGGAPGVDTESSTVKLLAALQYSSLCFTLFLAGWNDGTTGPLLPRMQENYNVRSTLTTERIHQLANTIFVFRWDTP